MTSHSKVLDRIVALAEEDETVRAVILEGSLASGTHVDTLSDYDINFYSTGHEHYVADDAWMDAIGDVLLYQAEVFDEFSVTIPTRLVLFRDQPRVDFSFWPLSILLAMADGRIVKESYRNGYQVLVDKDGSAARMPPPEPPGFVVTPPSRATLRQTCYDFWFEAHCVAKYLARGDLWYAKLIENRWAKDHFFRMALWQHQAARGWQHDPLVHLEGKRFEQWATPELLDCTARSFSPYSVYATWDSVLATVEAFNRMAQETASALNIDYPASVESGVWAELHHLRDRLSP